ncbi:LPS assembly lipoprotein LptE [Azospirillum sp. SYSU D00513]|uniref:LPS assembly lipoprotein LptE n=1 Tax=Azospirillum sp. SYSU D00513 TaxID=2812561 RepID=UPI0020004E64|nr:LPS assembly lipoprotein LptE [Azospirillum sp. SYSU D00513]
MSSPEAAPGGASLGADPVLRGRAVRSPLRPALLALALLGLGACGFQPLYGRGSATAGVGEALSGVEIGLIPERRGQQLRNLLIDRFHNSPSNGGMPYRLETGVSASEQKLALRKDASAERAQLVVVAPYRLIDNRDGKVVLQSQARAMISYNVLEQQYGALATLDYAYDRALVEISDEITRRVAMQLGRPAQAGAAAGAPQKAAP